MIKFRSKSKEIFYSVEWDTIMNSLIEFIPLNEEFNLYELSKKANLKYKDLITDGIANNKQTYVNITNHLIYNGFAQLYSYENIILTDKGRQLIELGSYNEFSKFINLKKESERKGYWITKNTLWIDFIKLLIGFMLGILSTLIFQN